VGGVELRNFGDLRKRKGVKELKIPKMLKV
jgi:hypothetical protein